MDQHGIAACREVASRFGARLKELRAQRGLTQAALGKLAGMAQSKIAEYESPTRRYVPSWETVLRICAALDVEATTFTRPPAEKESGKKS
jgi:transcriptional regulator with XRE-family HTH domain